MHEDLIDAHLHLYTPGPVKMAADTLALGGRQTPYFRNEAFSRVLLSCEASLLAMANAPEGSRVVFLTASGTAAMEAAVINLLSPARPVAVVNGGSFGARFVDICGVHRVPVHELRVDRDPLTDGAALAQLPAVDALLVNAHETSVGHLYDLGATGAWCQRQQALHIVDAISLFVTDPLDMRAQHIDALIVSSHKGLALPPGLAMVVLSPRALGRLRPEGCGSYYLDFAAYLRDGERGQTPFTPAVTIVLQLHQRLAALQQIGLHAEWRRVAALAAHFRQGLRALPLRPFSRHMPNAMTAVQLTAPGIAAPWLVAGLATHFGCVVAPNGGALRDSVFRVAHMGAATPADMDRLLAGLTRLLGVQR